MKHLKLTLLAAIAAFGTTGVASAQGLFNFEPADGNIYISGFVGAAFPDDLSSGDVANTIGEIELGNNAFVGGAVGAKLPFKSLGFIHTRVELEVSYFESRITVDGIPGDLGDLENIFIFGNSYADLIWKEDQAVIPYIGGGLGVAFLDPDGDVGTSTEFATHTAIGVTVPIGDLDLYTEGRYFSAYNDGPNVDGLTLTAGLRLKF